MPWMLVDVIDVCISCAFCKQEKHLRDKFRMQHSGGAVAATNNTAGGCDVDAAGEKADGISLSAGTERINSEEIQSLDKSPQRGAVVRGRRESECNTTAKITSPSHTAVTVDNGQRSVPVRSGSPDKKAHSQSTIRSPVQTTTNTDVVTVDHVSVVSCGGETRLTRLPHSSGGRASGHVSDSASRPHGRNDHRLRTFASGTGRSGYVSDTSFSAIVHSSANDSLRSTAAEGMCLKLFEILLPSSCMYPFALRSFGISSVIVLFHLFFC